MPGPKPRYVPKPRIWTSPQVSAWFGKSEGWFSENRPNLETEGFPRYDPLVKGWDAKAIELWRDQRSGIFAAEAVPDINPWDRTLGIGKGRHPVPMGGSR